MMHRMLWGALFALAVLPVAAQTMPAMTAGDGTLTDAKGMTLYPPDKHADRKSVV